MPDRLFLNIGFTNPIFGLAKGYDGMVEIVAKDYGPEFHIKGIRGRPRAMRQSRQKATLPSRYGHKCMRQSKVKPNV